ncbi:acyl-CoA dehydrogenase family protein [Achromobacter dolens]|uniref:acyl-CoA dehydrogenase family protein n=1 Tax=Achromobacter dolens TaxID=1287738 RepID=UPI0022B8BE2A|nr:acyl-CoA dehydrogenase family protein [Achromobacter dolens]MCZ8409165.1 acyl-CoA dehydrogenase family protein [Achromobacter dolens]
MNFDLEDDQRALVDTLNRLVSKEYSFEQRQRYARHSLGWSPDVWNSLAEIGLLALPFSEEDGGLGGTPTDLMLAAQALGKGALLEPFISSIVLCGGGFKVRRLYRTTCTMDSASSRRVTQAGDGAY